MASNEQLNRSEHPFGSSENLSRRAFLFGAGALAVGGLLAGCVAEPAHKAKHTVSAEPTPTPTETMTPTPEVVAPTEILGVNGEYFAAVPAWEQDFMKLPEGPLNKTNWNVLVGPGPGNSEAEYYTDNTNNVRVENGVLVLQSHVEDSNGYNYTSGRIDTRGKEDFLYGKFEINAKIPKGVGTWPAAWFLPTDEVYLKQHPGVNFDSYYVDGEIDMLEAIGSEQNKIYGIAHSLKNPVNPDYPSEYFSTKVVPDADTAFHTYGLEWTPTNLTFLIDNVKYYSVTKEDSYDFHQWPYDQKYYLIMNLAMGGSWAGQQTNQYPGDGIDKSVLPASFNIASVKYFPFVPK